MTGQPWTVVVQEGRHPWQAVPTEVGSEVVKAEGGRSLASGGQVCVNVGDVIRLRLPYSEACIHMRVAGKRMSVQVLQEGSSPVAQRLNDDGSRFSFPILLGEADIYTDGGGRHYVPARTIVTPEAGLDTL